MMLFCRNLGWHWFTRGKNNNEGGLYPLVLVYTRQSFPKPLIPQLAQTLRQVELPAPVEINQVVLEDALGTGIDIIAR
jgi:CxxC motif-containing protein